MSLLWQAGDGPEKRVQVADGKEIELLSKDPKPFAALHLEFPGCSGRDGEQAWIAVQPGWLAVAPNRTVHMTPGVPAERVSLGGVRASVRSGGSNNQFDVRVSSCRSR